MPKRLFVNRAKILSNKTTAAAITVILILTITATLVALPPANAHTPSWSIPTYTYIVVAPDPVGVNQQVEVVFWRDIPPPTAGGAYGDRWTFYVNITNPNGITEKQGPFTSDDVGGTYLLFTPDQVGTYYFVAIFPGQTLANDNPDPSVRVPSVFVGDYYEPSTSKQVNLTVQQEPIQTTPEVPLPTGYWMRPISDENRYWSEISGNWLMAKYDKDAVAFEYSGNWNRYTTAPNTGHIVWTKELTFGGITGGEYGPGMGYYMGLQYEPKFNPPIIMNGILYYDVAEPPIYGFRAVDIRTGETLWYQNSTYQLSFGQILDYESPNQHGTIPYLWSRVGSTLHMFDAFTGNYILSINNVPSGYMKMGPSGEILIYTLNTAGHWLSMWNSTLAIPPLGPTGTNAWQWRPNQFLGQTLDGTAGIQWNVTGNTAPSGSSFQWYWNDILISQAMVTPPDQVNPTLVHIAFDAKTGNQLWTQNRTNMGKMTFPGYVTPNEGVYALFVRETKQWVAWNVTTGQQIWVTDPIESDWGFYQYVGGFAYGKFYSGGYDGTLHAYDATTGKHLWDYYCGNAGLDTPYGSWPIFGAMIIADGKIIVGTNEHSPSMPLWRGEKLHVIDAETGIGVWNISGMYAAGRNGLGAIADGYLVTANGYDNRIYCFGKGLTATTVEASPEISVYGNNVLIKGTVTDQSPGAKDTPAIADEDMSPWMEYLYMQKPLPKDVKGVNVTLDTVDPNGNSYEIGRTTSDASGLFSYMWTPEVPGKYTVIATFAGSESYYSSYAETAIGVSEAPPATAAPEYPQPIDPTWTIVGMGVVLLIAIVIIGILLLRKK
jgi:hypothetical protein